jgi:aryl-alcohol dehydrogenase-like predicted oxidoreductase
MAAPAAGLAATQRRSLEVGVPLRFAPQSTPELKFRTLGGTGLKLTEVSFGCMITSDQTVVERALDLGVNYFDSARGYQNGNNERMVGAALASRRKEIHISTKTARTFTKADALADLDTSLQELKTDHVDIWYLHARDKVDAINDELLDALDTAKQQGKARFGGFSSHNTEVLNAWGTNPHMDVVLIPYNFSTDAARAAVVAKIAEAGKGVVGMKVMAGGFSDNKPGTPLR